jgi:pimeloyl-[acyl-carrier protein] methyl ester esterase
MDGTGELFAPLLQSLPSPFEAIVVHYPRDKKLTALEWIECVRSFLPASDSYVLVAESFSSPISIQIAATHPIHLRALVICAGFATRPMRGWRAAALRFFGPLYRPVRIPAYLVRRLFAGPGAPKSLVKMVQSAVASVRPDVLLSRLRAVLACDVRAELAQVTVPLLYLRAAGDRIVPPRCLAEIQQIKPETRAVTLDGPHLLSQREPQETARAITDFLRQLDGINASQAN